MFSFSNLLLIETLFESMDKDYRTKICADLILAIANAIKAGQFSGDELSPACQELLVLLDTENQNTFMELLVQFTSKWPQTAPILESVQKQYGAAKKVEQMFTRNNTPVNT